MGVALIGSQGLARLERTTERSPHESAAGRLWIGRLTLNDFRCYGEQRLEADCRPIVITGPNGAGKTNLLEAVSFLAPGRGLRGARLAEVARRQTPGDGGAPGRPWAVAARLHTAAGTVEIGFNSRYLLEITQQIEGDNARFSMADAASPTILRDVSDASALYVLMPMRV